MRQLITWQNCSHFDWFWFPWKVLPNQFLCSCLFEAAAWAHAAHAASSPERRATGTNRLDRFIFFLQPFRWRLIQLCLYEPHAGTIVPKGHQAPVFQWGTLRAALQIHAHILAHCRPSPLSRKLKQTIYSRTFPRSNPLSGDSEFEICSFWICCSDETIEKINSTGNAYFNMGLDSWWHLPLHPICISKRLNVRKECIIMRWRFSRQGHDTPEFHHLHLVFNRTNPLKMEILKDFLHQIVSQSMQWSMPSSFSWQFQKHWPTSSWKKWLVCVQNTINITNRIPGRMQATRIVHKRMNLLSKKPKSYKIKLNQPCDTQDQIESPDFPSSWDITQKQYPEND